MLVLELSKNYINIFYNGDFKKAIKENDGVLFNDEVIKNAFSNGNGSLEDFRRYVKNNKCFCKYYDLIHKKFL